MSNGPLNINLSIAAVKTTIPVIVDGHMVKAKLKDVQQVTNEKGDSIKFEWSLSDLLYYRRRSSPTGLSHLENVTCMTRTRKLELFLAGLGKNLPSRGRCPRHRRRRQQKRQACPA